MTPEEFLSANPHTVLKFGRSSEDGTWWADAREQGGRFISAHGGSSTLSDAIDHLYSGCQRCDISEENTTSFKLRPMLPDEYRRLQSYGLIENLEPDDTET